MCPSPSMTMPVPIPRISRLSKRGLWGAPKKYRKKGSPSKGKTGEGPCTLWVTSICTTAGMAICATSAMAVVRSMVLTLGTWAPAEERYRGAHRRRINPRRAFFAAESFLENRREAVIVFSSRVDFSSRIFHPSFLMEANAVFRRPSQRVEGTEKGHEIPVFVKHFNPF